jgi:hypothetical protein
MVIDSASNTANPCRLYVHQSRKSIVVLWTILFKLLK